MTSLFNQEQVTRAYGEEKLRQGRAEGEEQKARDTAFRMKTIGYDDSIIANILNISLSKLQSWFSESPTSMPQA